jgi:GntR family transcriptional regulator
MSLLVEQGFILRQHGRGTFVRSGLEGAPMLRFFRFGSGDAEIPHSKIVSRQASIAPSQVARSLNLGIGEPVLRLLRLRSVTAQPCLLEDIWLPLPIFSALQDDVCESWGPLLYPVFAQRCGVHVTRVVDEIAFGVLTAPQARHLRLATGKPCAVVTRKAYDLSGRCVEYRVTRGDAHAFHYTATIT